MKKLITAALLLVMLAGMFAGCKSETPQVPTDTSPVSRTVTLLTRSGKPVPRATVAIYADAEKTDLAFAGKTDDTGSFSYTAPATVPYYATVSGLPAGLTAEESYLLSKDTEITLKMGMLADVDMSELPFSVGDAMADFTVSDCEGNSYTLSQLLEEKKAVILNFWFMGCNPCKSEFPHLQAAYEQYSDKIEVLALNPLDSDNSEIAQFRKDNGYSFMMAKADVLWRAAFNLNAFPTTVVINQYGEISEIHVGATDTQGFTDMFEESLADSRK